MNGWAGFIWLMAGTGDGSSGLGNEPTASREGGKLFD